MAQEQKPKNEKKSPPKQAPKSKEQGKPKK